MKTMKKWSHNKLFQNGERTQEFFLNGKKFVCCVLPLLPRVVVFFLLCASCNTSLSSPLFMAFQSCFCGHSSSRRRLSVPSPDTLPSLFLRSYVEPHCYCHACKELSPISRYMLRSPFKAYKKKQLF